MEPRTADTLATIKARYDANLKTFAHFEMLMNAGVALRNRKATEFGNLVGTLVADARALGHSLPENVARFAL